MTELEKIERAKMYMDKLANGIDPISDTAAPDGDIINNIQLSRCFFFVSDVLRQVIENGGITPPPKEKLIPFAISGEKLAGFEFSERPIPISEIAKRINALSDCGNMLQMKYSVITNWLVEQGFLSAGFSSNGQRTKRPTRKGMETGIVVEDRVSSQGPYQVVVYNSEAQRLIIDHFDDILRAENANGSMQGQMWTQAQDERLVDLFQKGVPDSGIAAELKRSTSSIQSRLKKLGCQR